MFLPNPECRTLQSKLLFFVTPTFTTLQENCMLAAQELCTLADGTWSVPARSGDPLEKEMMMIPTQSPPTQKKGPDTSPLIRCSENCSTWKQHVSADIPKDCAAKRGSKQ
jgi:hypothetical protein